MTFSKYKILFFIAISQVVFGQFTEDLISDKNAYQNFYTTKTRAEINFGSTLDLESNKVITNSFLKDVYVNRTISQESKDAVQKRFKNKNQFGALWGVNLNLKYKLDSSQSIFIKATNQQYTTASFSKDAFNLITSGNLAYAGKTAYLDNSQIYNISYQTLGLGYEKNLGKKVIGGTISYVSLADFQKYEINKGSLYTDPDGLYIDYSNSGAIKYSDSAKSLILPNVGTGVSLGMHFIDYDNSDKLTYSISISDIGYARVNSMTNYKQDTSYHYEGYNLGNLLNINTEDLTKIRTDSIENILGIKAYKHSETISLPLKLNIQTQYELCNKLALLGDLSYVNISNRLPKAKIGVAYTMCSAFSVQSKIGFGGFGGVDLYLGLNSKLGSKTYLGAHANFVEYVFANKKTSGVGAQVSLIRQF